jgi:hypothetical protein
MKLRLTILTLFAYFFMTSCNPEESLNKQELNLEAYSLLKENLKKDLSIIGSELKGVKGEKRRMLALDIAKNYYGEETKQYDAFQMAFQNLNAPKNARLSNNEILSSFQKSRVESIINASVSYNNFDGYKRFLEQEFNNYAQSSLNVNDKNFMLTFLSSYEASYEFIATNPEMFDEIDQVGANGFWGCAAGIAGAVAVTTAIVGGLVNPPLWVLVASDWYLITSAGAASVVAIVNEC